MTASENYLQAFSERRAYCLALIDLSQQQFQLIAAEDYSGLLGLLSHKQQLIDLLVSSGAPESDLWQEWKQGRDRLSAADRAACETILDDTETLLRQLMQQEAQCTTHVATRHEAVQTALQQVQQAGVALNGYDASSTGASHRRLNIDL
ncbi:hypothetical protein GC163_06315 [bacterium]|nr:hypothetical protein [bacterium]